MNEGMIESATLQVKKEGLISAAMWSDLREWYSFNGRHELPWRYGSSPWEILVAEVLLHRTRATKVAEVFPGIVKEFRQPSAIVENPTKWLEMTYHVGLFWRAEAFVQTCEILGERHGGEVPHDEEALLSLPGIGPYIAATVRCFGFGVPAVIVDTNTLRLAGRLVGRSAAQVRRRGPQMRTLVKQLGEDALPPAEHDNYAILDLAGLVCVPASPRCARCPLLLGCRTGQGAAE